MSHATTDYWTRPHPEPVVLDIGDDAGALVLYVPAAMLGLEIEVGPADRDDRRVHTAVLERHVNGRTLHAAVYAELAPGRYRVHHEQEGVQREFSIVPGEVATLDWRS
ncbi:MAG: phospholipase [Candidatus Dormibacteraeota bacterium]|nr:phospholipase [Candidatus Dormibacteraeota bacterium]